MALSNYNINGTLSLRRSEGPQCELPIGVNAGGYLKSTPTALTEYKPKDETFTKVSDGSFTFNMAAQTESYDGGLVAFHFLKQFPGSNKGFTFLVHQTGGVTQVALGLWKKDGPLTALDVQSNRFGFIKFSVDDMSIIWLERYFAPFDARFPGVDGDPMSFRVQWSVESVGPLSTDPAFPSLPILRFVISGNPRSCDPDDYRPLACLFINYALIAGFDDFSLVIGPLVEDFGVAMIPFLLSEQLENYIPFSSQAEGVVTSQLGTRVFPNFLRENLCPLFADNGTVGLVAVEESESWDGLFDGVAGWVFGNDLISELALLIINEQWELPAIGTPVLEHQEDWEAPALPSAVLEHQEDWES